MNNKESDLILRHVTAQIKGYNEGVLTFLKKEIKTRDNELEGILFGLLGIAIIWPIVLSVIDFYSVGIIIGTAGMVILSGMCIAIFFKTTFRK